MKKAFTITELMVAVSVMAVVLVGTGYIFKVAIQAQRMAGATAEIMRNLRGITDQLNSDFAGLQTDAPMAIFFTQDTGTTVPDPNRFDTIMFFSIGDFSSYRANYGSGNNKVLKGNLARIWYGLADSNDPKENLPTLKRPAFLRPAARILARNQHILIAPDPAYIDWPQTNFSRFAQPDASNNSRSENETFEYDMLSLAQWKAVAFLTFMQKIGPSLEESTFPLSATTLPDVALSDPCTFNNLMCKGVGSFAVQWGYKYVNAGAEQWRWWPSNDPDGDKNTSDSHFTGAGMMGQDMFGVCFNFTNVSVVGDWRLPKYETNALPDNFPRALKFTFTLYDSKGIIKNGLKFTHIVYLKH
jgi:prepilin-type N-terminal cleavage/methylation domain-containing protein